ncbi:hypothetical protein GUJ93_ZPchr0006g46282 [Zizania palustris]|uniref:Uncharacterized protein n=1 Tax=Zizania palustris TaxID=103762 RepID=A0A8J5W298_ZIZPA|nr:hypothetical protein GUJ93_ZPchr0006g46282 [Zizania palustris]
MDRRREKDGTADQVWDETGQQIGVGGDRQRVGGKSAGRRRRVGSSAQAPAPAFGRTKAQLMPSVADIFGPGDGQNNAAQKTKKKVDIRIGQCVNKTQDGSRLNCKMGARKLKRSEKMWT